MRYRYVNLIVIAFVLLAIWLQSGITEIENKHYYTHLSNNILFTFIAYQNAFLCAWFLKNKIPKLTSSSIVVLGLILIASNFLNIHETWPVFLWRIIWLGLLAITPLLVLRRSE